MRICLIVDFQVLTKYYLRKVKQEKNTWTLLENWKKTMESDGNTNYKLRAQESQEMIGTGVEGVGHKWKNGDHLN